MKNKYTSSTLKFTLVGFFIPVFTLIGIGGIQGFIETIVNDCELAWNVLFIVMTVGAIITPFIFGYRAINWDLETDAYRGNLLTYNLIEYTFLQACIAWPFTNNYILCYGTDGQNGMQFGFSAWIALLLLIVYSIILDLIHNKLHT